jgi:hypothetical protein
MRNPIYQLLLIASLALSGSGCEHLSGVPQNATHENKILNAFNQASTLLEDQRRRCTDVGDKESATYLIRQISILRDTQNVLKEIYNGRQHNNGDSNTANPNNSGGNNGIINGEGTGKNSGGNNSDSSGKVTKPVLNSDKAPAPIVVPDVSGTPAKLPTLVIKGPTLVVPAPKKP